MGFFCHFLVKRKIFLGLYCEKFLSAEEFLQAICEKQIVFCGDEESGRCFQSIKFHKKY